MYHSSVLELCEVLLLPPPLAVFISSSSVIDDRHNDDQTTTVLVMSSSSNSTPLTINLSFDNNEVVNVLTDQKSRRSSILWILFWPYAMEMDDNNDVRCSICQELLDKRDLVYALPSCMMHIFHVQYLLRRAWKREKKCPNYRWQY